MQAYLERILREKINKKLRNIPVVAILGPRQCGKSTLIKSPKKGFWNVINDLSLDEVWIVAPVNEPYPIEKGVTVSPLGYFMQEMKKISGQS